VYWWLWIVVIAFVGFIGLAIYSAFKLRKDENWEEQQPNG